MKDQPYLIGRAVAITECLVDVPHEFVSLVQVNPLQKLTYHLREALKTGDDELLEVAQYIGELPARLIDPKAQYHTGYYHQKAWLDKCEARRELGRKIAKAREEKGMTIRELAEKCEVNFANISKIEAGKYNVGMDILQRIAKALGMRIELV